jgi:hypothetical protein
VIEITLAHIFNPWPPRAEFALGDQTDRSGEPNRAIGHDNGSADQVAGLIAANRWRGAPPSPAG